MDLFKSKMDDLTSAVPEEAPSPCIPEDKVISGGDMMKKLVERISAVGYNARTMKTISKAIESVCTAGGMAETYIKTADVVVPVQAPEEERKTRSTPNTAEKQARLFANFKKYQLKVRKTVCFLVCDFILCAGCRIR